MSETGMDIGLLLLRVVTGAVIMGHGMQKLRGWFSGPGFAQSARMFESWGFRPAKASVVLACVSEVAGGLGLVLGFLLPVLAAMLVGTMLVACVVSSANGLWAVRNGCELPLVYGLIGASVGFTGGGRLAVDHVLGLQNFSGPVYGAAALVVGIAAAAPSLLRRQAVLSSPRPSERPT